MPNADLKIIPVNHATLMFSLNGKNILTDPFGDARFFAGLPKADIILITDIHRDHYNPEALEEVVSDEVKIVCPKVVFDQMPQNWQAKSTLMANGEKTTLDGLQIEAVPMYNLPQSPDSKHTKGRGNGYVVEADGQRVYISGDSSGILEMRELKNITYAFVCMNMPYTMSVQEAAEAILDFNPKHVTPYHYRGTEGLSDINKFKELVNQKNPGIQVELLNFYP